METCCKLILALLKIALGYEQIRYRVNNWTNGADNNPYEIEEPDVQQYIFYNPETNHGNIIIMAQGSIYAVLEPGQSSVQVIAGAQKRELDCTLYKWQFVQAGEESNATDVIRVARKYYVGFNELSQIFKP